MLNSSGTNLDMTPLSASLFGASGSLDQSKLQSLVGTYQNPGEHRDLKKLKKVANEFEALFVKQLMDAMDKTVEKTGLLDGGAAEETFKGLLNQEISNRMTQRPGGSGLGLAKAIYEQMAKQVAGQTELIPDELKQPIPFAKPAIPINQAAKAYEVKQP